MANILDTSCKILNNLAHLGQWDPQDVLSYFRILQLLLYGIQDILNTVASVSNYYLICKFPMAHPMSKSPIHDYKQQTTITSSSLQIYIVTLQRSLFFC